jgi:hypothetical protein
VLTTVTYKGVEFMDTVTFCGLTCHRVMRPEYTAFRRSPHAGTACVDCHIGPGAPWFVRSKLSGIPQVYHYTLQNYERPIPTPVAALRPSRDTCEHCHWPERFYGNALRTKITYASDRDNTINTRVMAMRVGSGTERGSGIHNHIVQKIWYLPANAKRTEIAKVWVRHMDGTTGEYVNPAYRDQLGDIESKLDRRFMDCIDCHNRPAHQFVGFEALLDLAITEGEVDHTIPYIKRMAMTAAPEIDRPPTEAEQKHTIERIDHIPEEYRTSYPEVYQARSRNIESATNKIHSIYADSSFPHMRISSGTYSNWATHEGCFRCHGSLVRSGGSAQEKLERDCLLCHTLPETVSAGGQRGQPM